MNEYKITYTGEGEGYQIVTERTEADAKKFFLSMNKSIKLDITSIELYRENAIATKQQERDTLAAIRKMVEELGPQSYLATAFEGCFEDAESNIENDFGDSMKARLDLAKGRLKELTRTTTEKISQISEQFEESKRDLEAARKISDEKDAEIAALRERTLSLNDLTDAITIITEKRQVLDAEVKNATERLVEAAEEPESAAFRNAVKDHRAAKASLNHYTALVERLAKAMPD